MIRIATWNLERPKLNGREKNDRILSKLKKVNEDEIDIWVFTETNASISLGERYFSVATLPVSGYHSLGESTTTIWTRLPMIKRIVTYDPDTAVCIEVESSLGPMIIYGAVITYAGDKGPNQKSKRWQEHLSELKKMAEEWCRIRKEYPDRHLIVAGDFNQNPWQRKENEEAKKLLFSSLDETGLTCLTNKDFPEIDRVNIDHICVSEELADKVSTAFAWNGSKASGKMSDHNGVCVVFETSE